jgi:hypothetical protein
MQLVKYKLEEKLKWNDKSGIHKLQHNINYNDILAYH